MVAKKGYVEVITDRHEPERVAEECGYEPRATDEDAVEKQLDKVEDHQQREEGTEKGEGHMLTLNINKFFCISLLQMNVKAIAPLDVLPHVGCFQ